MKKTILFFICLCVLLFSACQRENSLERPFNLYQVEKIVVLAGDNSALVSWETQDGKPDPESFILAWTPDAAGLEGGQVTLSPDKREYLVEDLVNDCSYLFTVQAKYPDGLSQKVSEKCTPRTSRLPVTDFTANAGDGRILLRWKKPAAVVSSYKITWTPGGGSQSLTDTSLERYMVEGLTNGTEYTFTMVCNYPKGESEAVSASATPGLVNPIMMSIPSAVRHQPVTFECNPMYFISGEVESIAWDLGDGNTATGESVLHRFLSEGTFTVKVTVTYTNHTTEDASVSFTVSGFKWSELAITKDGYIGYVKTSSVVFSHDGNTMYISTSNSRGDVFAFDTWTGEIKWTYPIDKVTYGGGPMVGPDGVIYVGARDKKFRAINPDGSLKWSLDVAGNVDGFPAITSDNKLYVVSNGTVANLYAVNPNNGTVRWSKELEGNVGSAVAVDRDGNVYVGTNSAVWSYTEDGTFRWKSSSLTVTESGSFAINGSVLYAGLKGNDGVAALDMETGDVKWKTLLADTDSFSPVVGPDGTIYYASRNRKQVFAINPDGTKKWETAAVATFIYASPALSSDGKLYIATQANYDGSKQVLTINASDGSHTLTPTEQVMCAFSFGPDDRVYYGTVTGVGGSTGGHIYAIETAGPADSWCMRGGNMQGTNSLK